MFQGVISFGRTLFGLSSHSPSHRGAETRASGAAAGGGRAAGAEIKRQNNPKGGEHDSEAGSSVDSSPVADRSKPANQHDVRTVALRGLFNCSEEAYVLMGAHTGFAEKVTKTAEVIQTLIQRTKDDRMVIEIATEGDIEGTKVPGGVLVVQVPIVGEISAHSLAELEASVGDMWIHTALICAPASSSRGGGMVTRMALVFWESLAGVRASLPQKASVKVVAPPNRICIPFLHMHALVTQNAPSGSKPLPETASSFKLVDGDYEQRAVPIVGTYNLKLFTMLTEHYETMTLMFYPTRGVYDLLVAVPPDGGGSSITTTKQREKGGSTKRAYVDGSETEFEEGDSDSGAERKHKRLRRK